MARRAARVRRRVFDFQRIGNLLRARRRERGRRSLRMKILERPSQELILFRATTAVAAGTGTGLRAQKFHRRIHPARRGNDAQESGDEGMTKCFTHGVKLVNGLSP